MGDRTKIEWANATWNPIRARIKGDTPNPGFHCETITPGCQNCYAEAINKRLGTGLSYLRYRRDQVDIVLDEKILQQPLHWRRPRRIFPCSMTDLFGDWVPYEMLDRIFGIIALSPHHTFLPLTKRAERMRDYLTTGRRGKIYDQAEKISEAHTGHRSIGTGAWPLENLWAGVSVEDQRRADERIPLLLETPAAVRWISYEPALEGIDISRYLRRMVVRPCEELTERMADDGWSHSGGQGDHPGLSWVVCGGESGPGARPFGIQWARSIIKQCREAGTACFVKQVGARPYYGVPAYGPKLRDRKGGDPDEWPIDIRVREYPNGAR